MSIDNIITVNVPELHFRKIQAGICFYFCLPKGEIHDFRNNLVHFINLNGREFEDSENVFKVIYADTNSSMDVNIFTIERKLLCHSLD